MRVVQSRIEYWSDDYDRRVLIIKFGVVIVGIDFMQGEEPCDFTDSNGDSSILTVYNASRVYLSGNDDLECVNQAINIWFDLGNEGVIFDRV
jgi:hypothetical protein